MIYTKEFEEAVCLGRLHVGMRQTSIGKIHKEYLKRTNTCELSTFKIYVSLATCPLIIE
jgi:hypothetical protein